MTAVAVAKCRHGCRVRLVVEVDAAQSLPVAYWGQTPPVVKSTPLADAIPFLVWCREHKHPMKGRLIRGRFADVPCSDRCTLSESEICRCSCGGINHGSEVK
jgi:hypothetical protein